MAGADRLSILSAAGAQIRDLTTRCYRHIISDKSNDGQDAPQPVEMGNVSLELRY